VHSDRLADELARFLGDPHPPITVVPHGVWTVPDADTCPPLRDRLALKRLLFFSAIRRNKRLDLLPPSAHRLPGSRLPVPAAPVVAGRAGGLSELLDEYEIGTTFETGSPEGLAQAVHELHDMNRCPRVEDRIFAARRRFTWAAAAAATVAGCARVGEAAREPVTEANDCVLGTTPAH